MQGSETGKAVLAQFAKLKAIRTPLDKEYQECYDYTKPSLGVGFMNEMNDGVSAALLSGQKQADKFTTTATEAVCMLASSVLSSMTPGNNRWVDLAVPMFDSDSMPQDAKEWLENAATYLHTMVNAFDGELHVPGISTKEQRHFGSSYCCNSAALLHCAPTAIV